MQTKHWKLIIAIVFLAGAGATYWKFGREASTLPDRVSFVCVATGKTYRYSRADMPSILPAANPDTGKETLLPIVQHEDRNWYVDSFYGSSLRTEPELAEVNKYVDPETLQVLKNPR